jgi:DNA-binding PadR family transcriptional regulator
LILDALAEQPRHGYEIIQAIEQRSGGTYRPSPGVVYPTLQMLEELGHVRVVEQDARKVYAITEEGTRELNEHKAEISDFYERSSEQDWESQLHAFKDLKRQVAQLFMTYKRASLRGRMSAEAQGQVHAVLHSAIQQLQEILESAERKR